MLPSNSNCPGSSIDDKQFINYKCDDTSTSHSFTHCFWDNSGLASGGGAIHVVFTSSYSSLSLTVDDCTFLHCHETGSVDGGGIYAQRIDTATVKDSFFFDCTCGNSHTGPEGAGILLNYIQTLPLIKSCVFVSCTTADDGGGCGIYYSYSTLTYAVDSCRCIKCKGTDPSSSEGAVICLSANFQFILCTNCLLYACDALSNGGGIWLDCIHSSTTKKINFCFFSENKSGGAIDICLYRLSSMYDILIHCFSTCPRKRITIYNDGTDYDAWLPQSILDA